MAEEDHDGADSVRQHVRKVLARLSAFKDRQRAQESGRPTGSLDNSIEVDREDDDPSGIDDTEGPS